jgi:flagellar biogenesis protein FliO
MVVSCSSVISRFLSCAVLIASVMSEAAADIGSSEAISKAQTQAITPVLGASMLSSSLKMVGALFFCLGIFAVGVKLARRFAPTPMTSRRRRLEIREKISLNSKSAIFLIAVDNREYLVTSGSEHTSIQPAHSITTPIFSESLDELCDESGEAHV